MTTLESVRAHMDSYRGATSGYPFGPGAQVYKVGGKMFGLIAENEQPLRVNLKCDPEAALQLRAGFEAIIPGYHMNKRHWNTVILDGTVPEPIVLEMFDDSYERVFASLTRTGRDRIAQHGA